MIEKDENMKKDILEKILENKEKATTIEILRKAIEYKAVIKDIIDEEEKKKIIKDACLLQSYNTRIELPVDFGVRDSDINIGDYKENEYDGNIIRFVFKGKEIVAQFSRQKDYLSMTNLHYCEFIFFTNVNTKKRLHVKSESYLFKKTPYDRCFIDYEKHLDKFDMENDEKYQKEFSEMMIELKNKESLNLEKYQLSDSEKEFLRDLFVTYNFIYSLVLKDGIMCIHSRFEDNGSYKGYIQKICYFIDFITKLLEKFMYK